MKKIWLFVFLIIFTLSTLIIDENTKFLSKYIGDYIVYLLFLPLILLPFLGVGNKINLYPETKVEAYLGNELKYTVFFDKTKTHFMGKSDKCSMYFNFCFLNEKEIKFFFKNQKLYIEVLGDNAVHLNRQKLHKNKPTEIFGGDIVKKGKFQFLIY
jgi:hypothetical protein